MASKILGVANLQQALTEMTKFSSSEWRSSMAAAVREPAKIVVARAEQNIAKFSPGKTDHHFTYKGNLVFAGFASRSIVMNVNVHPENGVSVANISVSPQAFYALAFWELGDPAKGIARTPWLVPALESTQDVSIPTATAALLGCVNKIAARHAGVTPS